MGWPRHRPSTPRATTLREISDRETDRPSSNAPTMCEKTRTFTWHRKLTVLDLKRMSVLFLREHHRRLVWLHGVTAHPSGEWVAQQSRKLTIMLDEWATQVKLLMRDRDAEFVANFDAAFAADGVQVVKAPVSSGGIIPAPTAAGSNPGSGERTPPEAGQRLPAWWRCRPPSRPARGRHRQRHGRRQARSKRRRTLPDG